MNDLTAVPWTGQAEREGRACCGLPMNTLDVFGVRLYQCSHRSHHPVIFRNLSTGEELAESYDGGKDGGLRWAAHPDPETTEIPACPGFLWIGQSFATCDGCGKPAWEHAGEMRLREGAALFGGSGADWELRPWKPGEAEAIKRKWGP